MQRSASRVANSSSSKDSLIPAALWPRAYPFAEGTKALLDALSVLHFVAVSSLDTFGPESG